MVSSGNWESTGFVWDVLGHGGVGHSDLEEIYSQVSWRWDDTSFQGKRIHYKLVWESHKV